jgi:hypothetical protein
MGGHQLETILKIEYLYNNQHSPVFSDQKTGLFG